MHHPIKVLATVLSIGFSSLTNAAIIFETDFSDDTGWKATTKNGIWQQSNPPTGWNAYKVPGGSDGGDMSVESGEGLYNTNALKLTWSTGSTSLAVSLGKHLTNDINTGYDELYIRYHVRFSDNWKAGTDGTDINYWKWGRLWQNTPVTDQSQWTENRGDSRYVVWNFNGNPNPYINAVWADNVSDPKGSAGGPRVKIGWADSPITQGHFESISEWTINRSTQPGFFNTYPSTPQGWHTLEFHFKLSTVDVLGNGVFEVWLDGVKQADWSSFALQSGAVGFTGIPTKRYKSGFNFFTLFDNMAGWSKDWDDGKGTRHLYVNDVVISDSYIGHDYHVGRAGPAPINLPKPLVN